MTRLIARLKTSRTAYKLEIKGKLTLPFSERQLPKGEALRTGDLATAADGHVYEIVAHPEKLLQIDCQAPREAAIIGYVLGNGHVPAEIGEGYVRILHVPELEAAFPSLGVHVSQLEAPFDPNVGNVHHGHDHDDHDHHHH